MYRAVPAKHDAQVAAIASRLQARAIKVFMANVEFRSISIADWQADRRHMTSEGHRIIGSRLAAQIAAAIGKH